MKANAATIKEEPFFKTAISFAKALARLRNMHELSPILLLGGIHHALGRSAGEAPEAALRLKDKIADAAGGLMLGGDALMPAPVEERMPLAPSLRKLLAGHSLGWDRLIGVLLESCSRTQGDMQRLFDVTRSLATGFCRRTGLAQVSSEVFAVAAYAAFKSGDFSERPAVSAHIAANRKCFETLIQDNGWDIGRFQVDESVNIPYSDEFSAHLASAGEDDHPFIFAINRGMQIGAASLNLISTAFHESGHAIVSFVLRPELPVTHVSVIPGQDYAGVTAYDRSAPFWQRSDMLKNFKAELCTALAGRAAQRIRFGDDHLDSGSENDLENATRFAWDAVAKFGLDAEIGPVNLPALARTSGETGGYLFQRAQRRVQAVLKEAALRTDEILRENWHYVENVAGQLVRRKFLGSDDLIFCIADDGLPDWPGVREARSIGLQRKVRFASGAGIIDTAEGPVRHRAGDAIVTGTTGETWPVARPYFDANYEPAGDVVAGQDGAYRKKSRPVRAMQLRAPRRIVLSRGRGILDGQAGDWIVDYGGGDLAIVSNSSFADYYKL